MQDLFGDEDDDPPPLTHSPATVRPAEFGDALLRLGRQLPASVFLGTSSWSFPGWQGIVWGDAYSESSLARGGLSAYAQHPLLRLAGIDRSYHRPLPATEFARYAAQVPRSFRFLVKAPALITDSHLRGERGQPGESNPYFLDVGVARDEFVLPAMQGLGSRAGPLLFQLPPLPRELTMDEAGHAVIGRLGDFLAALPRSVAAPDGDVAPIYAIELRNAELLTPRFVRMLRDANTRLAIGIHSRMPPAARQSAALRALDALPGEGDDWRLKGPLVVRWNLNAGLRYEDARTRYAPFDRIIDPDIATRGTLSHLVHVALKSGQASYVIAGNKAEGSAPLTLIELAKAIVA